jgi:hypothetical protein
LAIVNAARTRSDQDKIPTWHERVANRPKDQHCDNYDKANMNWNVIAQQRIAADVAAFLTYFGPVLLVITVHTPPITSDVARPKSANNAANPLLIIVRG